MPFEQSNQLLTERLLLKRPCRQDANRILAYRLANRDHLRSWEPARDDFFYTLQATENQLGTMQKQMEEETAEYWIVESRANAEMVGECSFTNIVRGSFQACHLGFSIAREFEGMGLMHEALQMAISDIFVNHGLHRIMANFQPSNSRSEKLLKRLGFQHEGLALEYLKINGKWMDHILTSKINPAG
ncbi:acetyltransferase, ribosomal protein N-acetylase [Herbaspirillum sp. CF444]|uniref:GNAT family N-acetyltransferase n=1 Tax=Herbaspirillum sp. CF444 TaxID=1144319 RepID=UPI0002724690|nr:GNAT family N-acetyltransferase [Herbaspirillum sp. CF444]EJL81214.1 acetyltransferase, ribosomal protein N-acetylase [Herbaspirillum sp. CF444]